MRRLLLAALFLPFAAWAQTSPVIGVPPSLEVSRLAPQLVPFLGSQANFDALVNALAFGTPVTLTTPLAGGATQVVSFTPTGTMTSLQIAQTLEAARQSLISRGVATPTAQQVAVALNGGALPTPVGAVQVGALLPATQTQSAAAGASAPSTVTTTVTTTAPNGQPAPSVLLQNPNGQPAPSVVMQNQRDAATLGNNAANPGTEGPATLGNTTANPGPASTTTPSTSTTTPSANGAPAPSVTLQRR